MAKQTQQSDHQSMLHQVKDLRPLDAQDAKPLDANEQAEFDKIAGGFDEPGPEATNAGIDQAESFANDPANHQSGGEGSSGGFSKSYEGNSPNDLKRNSAGNQPKTNDTEPPKTGDDAFKGGFSKKFEGNTPKDHGIDPALNRSSKGIGRPESANHLHTGVGHHNTDKAAGPGPEGGPGGKRLDVKSIIAKANGAGMFVKKNRKGFLVGGGIVGLLGTLVMGFIALLPLKIEALMKAAYGEAFDRVEHTLERRAERFFIRFAMQTALSSQGGVVSTGAVVGDLYKTWRVQRAEGKFFERQGLKISQGSTRSSIRVDLPEGQREFRNAPEFDRYVNQGDLRGREARNFIRLVARDQTRWYNVLKRRHIRRWMSLAYGIRVSRIRFWERRSAQPANNAGNQATRTAFDTSLHRQSNETFGPRSAAAMNCILSGASCPDGTRPMDPDLNTPNQANEAGRAAAQAVDEAAAEGNSKTFGKILGEKLTKALSSKVIPFVGWFDLAARIDDFMWNRRGEKLMVEMRKAQYAAMFATWATLADQFKHGLNADGTPLEAHQVDAALSKLDEAENSRAHQELFSQKSAGEDISKKKDLNVSQQVETQYDLYKIQHVAVHPIFVAWLKTGGAILDALGWLLVQGILLAPGAEEGFKWVGGQLVDLLEWVIGPVCMGKDGGSVIYNCVRMGAHITANDYMSNELGGKEVTPKAVMERKALIATERRAQKVALWDRMFSPDVPSSFINRLAIAIPYNPMTAFRDGFSRGLAAIANPLGAAGGGLQFAYNSTSARVYADYDVKMHEHGVKFYDYSEEELMREPDVAALEEAWKNAQAAGRTLNQVRPEDCPKVDEGKVNLCKLDVVSVQALKSIYTTEDDGGYNSDPLSAPAAAGPAGDVAIGEMCNVGPGGAALDVVDGSCAAYWAQQMLNNPNIIRSNSVVTDDLRAAVNKQIIQNGSTCGNPIRLHPALLFALNQTAANGGFKIGIWNIASGHGCDRFLHPKGRATDIGSVNGIPTDTGSGGNTSRASNRAFSEYIAKLLPQGSHILQSNCFDATMPANGWVTRGPDGCNHIHVDVGSRVQ